MNRREAGSEREALLVAIRSRDFHYGRDPFDRLFRLCQIPKSRSRSRARLDVTSG